jgi:hypothetical protein
MSLTTKGTVMALTQDAKNALRYYGGDDTVERPSEAVYRGLMAAGYFTPAGEFTDKGKEAVEAIKSERA